MLKLNKNTQTFLEVLLIYYLAQTAYPGMPDHTLQKLHNQTVTSMNVQLLAKNQYNNLNFSENTGNSLFPEDIVNLLFQSTFGKIRHA